MKKPFIIIIVLVGLILLAFFFKKFIPTKGIGTPGGVSSQAQKSAEGESIQGSMLDLFKSGRPMKCTATFNDESGKMDTTVYVSGEKSYAESDITMEEGVIKSYSIYDGTWFYNWSDQAGMATKMKVPDVQEMAKKVGGDNAQGTGAQKAAELQKSFDYKCKAWLPDQSKFTPPADIEFSDITQMLQDFSESFSPDKIDEMTKNACKTCDLIPDATKKAECKANLKCE